jgi:hypothetical protein
LNDQGYTSQQLMDFFARETSPGSGVYEGNVIVGTCGTGQEQGFTAAKLAIEKALAGEQPGVARSEWPHSGAKMVVVFVGDEDDCSSPEDESPTNGIIYGVGVSQPCTGNPRLYSTTTYSGFLAGLGRPLGTAYVVSAHALGDPNATCTDFDCVAGLCCASACGGCGASFCGGQQAGTRFLEMRDQLGAGASPASDIVAGSICDPNFGEILERVADIVRPPDVLELPTPPASDVLTVLRIVDEDAGLTIKTCVGPAGPGLTEAQAAATGCGGGPCDWWFVADRSGSRDSLQVSQFVYINPASTYCQANPGETYSADYLGRLPEDGCTSANDCVAALGGSLADWTCEVPIVGQPGTCVCGG